MLELVKDSFAKVQTFQIITKDLKKKCGRGRKKPFEGKKWEKDEEKFGGDIKTMYICTKKQKCRYRAGAPFGSASDLLI